MNKTEFISAVAQKAGMTKKATTEFVEAYAQVVIDTIAKGEDIHLLGFGKFQIKERAAKTGYSPVDRTPIQIPAKKVVKFKPSTTLSEAANS